jgi:hypothetical protein
MVWTIPWLHRIIASQELVTWIPWVEMATGQFLHSFMFLTLHLLSVTVHSLNWVVVDSYDNERLEIAQYYFDRNTMSILDYY